MFDRVRMGETFRNDTVETAIDDAVGPPDCPTIRFFFAIDYIPPIGLIIGYCVQ